MEPKEHVLWTAPTPNRASTPRYRVALVTYSDGSQSVNIQELGSWPKHGVPTWQEDGRPEYEYPKYVVAAKRRCERQAAAASP